MPHLGELSVKAVTSKVLLGLRTRIRASPDVRGKRLARASVDLSGEVVDEDLFGMISAFVSAKKENKRAHRVRLAISFGVKLLHHAVHLDEVGLKSVEEALGLTVLRGGAESHRVVLRERRSAAGERQDVRSTHLDDVANTEAVGVDGSESEEAKSCDRRGQRQSAPSIGRSSPGFPQFEVDKMDSPRVE